MKTLNKKQGGVPPAATSKDDPATAWENPLIPNKRLRQLYTAMVELRLHEAHFALRKAASGEEAIRVSTALSLLSGDLTSEPSLGSATAFLRSGRIADPESQASQLPVAKDPTVRLHIAIGAALARGSKKKSPLVLAYVHPGDLSLPEWKPILRLAAGQAAPILFVTLPGASPAKKPGQLSLASTKCGVPGIPVDAADAVALYRVAQESMLRARAGGGPVLMECIPFQLPGKKSPPTDPILNLRESLLRRKLADKAWLDAVPNRFAARLKAAAL